MRPSSATTALQQCRSREVKSLIEQLDLEPLREVPAALLDNGGDAWPTASPMTIRDDFVSLYSLLQLMETDHGTLESPICPPSGR